MEAVTAGKDQSQMGLKCPRCGSLNTKFCYYNNYSLTQPRYLCKTCRRYWTQGGNLRDVPLIIAPVSVNKKTKASKPCFNDFHCPSIGTLSSTTKNCTSFSNGDGKTGSSLKLHIDLVNSIESLISINHDMHLKLRQQRLATLGFGHRVVDQRSLQIAESSALSNHQMQKPKQRLPKEWCFDNCYVPTSASNHSGTGNHRIQRKDEER